MRNSVIATIRSLIAVTSFWIAGSTVAQTLPNSFEVSPEIFKVLVNNDKFRVVEAIYAPGQRSKAFSSAGYFYYFITDCYLRRYHPDGRVQDLGFIPAGNWGQSPPYDSAAFENVGEKTCRTLSFLVK